MATVNETNQAFDDSISPGSHIRIAVHDKDPDNPSQPLAERVSVKGRGFRDRDVAPSQIEWRYNGMLSGTQPGLTGAESNTLRSLLKKWHEGMRDAS